MRPFDRQANDTLGLHELVAYATAAERRSTLTAGTSRHDRFERPTAPLMLAARLDHDATVVRALLDAGGRTQVRGGERPETPFVHAVPTDPGATWAEALLVNFADPIERGAGRGGQLGTGAEEASTAWPMNVA